MAFTTWAALETSILDAIEAYVTSGSAITKSYSLPDGRTHTIRSYDELKNFLEYVRMRKKAEEGGIISTRVSYGRYRRFR